MILMKLVDKIVNATNNNETTAGVGLNLSKAYDTVKHEYSLRQKGTLRTLRCFLGLIQKLPH